MFYCVSKKMAHRVVVAALTVFILGSFMAITFHSPEEQPVSAAVALHEWGLSFQKENTPPIPNLTAEALRPYGAYYCSPEAEKRLYITFDAGYENGNTPAILDALKKHNAPGAFFVVGTYIKDNPDLIKRMVAEGHSVGNHTYHHPNMTQKDEAAFKAELNELSAVFKETTGQDLAPFYRPPEGKFTDDNLRWAQDLGYKTIFWSLAYVDWKQDGQPTHEEAFGKLIPRTHDGAIVLLHSTSATNAEILDELLTKWEEMGYTFGSLTELGAT